MSPERWQQIEQVYHGALEREPGQRAEYVAEACGGDVDLQKEVASLLQRDASDPANLLNRPAGAVLTPGMRLGPYEVESKLGAGGMGEVWKARDTRLGRTVALKISKAEFIQRFEREARAVAALNHPHIAALYDVGPNYFVMEYVAGQPLSQLIPRKGMALDEALDYAVQIADALAAAHAAGIVHRDLKPGNIMVGAGGNVKVVDFGLARVAPPKQPSPDDPTFTQTAEGAIAGTVSYMSPEQAQGKIVDARSDIFSFGAVWYEMLTGTRAFAGDSSVAILAEILHKEPRSVGELPSEVQTLLHRCLRKDPARRAQSMADVRVALVDLKDDSAGIAVPAPRRRRRPVWLVAAAAAVVLAAAGVWYSAGHRQPENAPMVAVPLTSYPGNQVEPSLSPDGDQVAFAWNGPQRDNWDIYVKVVGEGEPLRLTSDPADERSPAWSPDGRWIAFAHSLPANRYALMLISPLGGAERKLGEYGIPEAQVDPTFAWTNDSRHLVIPIGQESNHTKGLFLLSLDSGDLRQLTGVSQSLQAGDFAPAMAPDGRTLAFNRLTALSIGDLYTLNLGNDLTPIGAPRLVVREAGASLAWTADGKELIYSALASALQRVAVSGPAKPQVVAATGDAAHQPSISRPGGHAGSRLVWTRSTSDTNIYRLELSDGPGQAANPQALIASVFRDVFPQYSPDGKSLAFYSGRSGIQEIWVCQADGSHPRQLTHLGGPVSATPRWSPDGRQISFDSNDGGGIYEVYLVSADGGPPKRMTAPPSTNFGVNWSLDGHWLYFTSNRSGAMNVWKMPAAGGPAEQITHNGGSMPTVSPDGLFLYYVKQTNPFESSLWRAPLAGGEEAQLVSRIHRFSYAVTRRGIYYSVPQASNSAGTIEFLDPKTGRQAVLFRTDKRLDSGMAISPDGRYLLYPQIDFEGATLMMIENFR